MKKLRTILIIILCLLVVFTITGFFVLPPVLVSVASKNLGQALHRQVTIRKIKVNPYTLAIEVQDLSIKDRERTQAFVSFGSLMIDMEWISLFRRAPVVREVRLDRPSVRIIRFQDNTYNFSDLLKPEEKKTGKPLSFSVSNIQITGGTVVFDDRPVHKTHTAEGITLAIPFLSNMPHLTDVFVQPSFKAVINGTPITLKGRSKPFSESLESTLTIDLKEIDVPSYLAYLPMKLGFAMESCRADLNATVTFRQFRDKRRPESSTSGSVVLRDIAVNDLAGGRLFTLPTLAVTIAPSQVLQKKIHIRKLDIASPELTLSRDKAGTLNVARALEKTNPGAKPSVSSGDGRPAEPLVLTIDDIILAGGKVSYSDASGSSPVKIDAGDLSVAARGISTAGEGGGTAEITCSVNRTGRLSLGTSFVFRPLSADITLTLEGFQPAWVQPYFIDKVPVLVRRGMLSSKGRVRLARTEGRPLDLKFTGDVRVTEFASVDRARAEDLVSWKDLSITGIDFALNPGRLAIGEVSLSAPVSAYIINQDGTSNLSAVAGRKEASTETPAPDTKEKALQRISVGKVNVAGGRFTFTDRSVTPKYTSSLSGIGGTVTGLSSDEFKKATVNLRARLDNQAPIVIAGSINPFKEDLFVDLTASLKNMELSPVTPYSGKYAGYVIDKGKLSLDLKYSIDKKELSASNDVLIDQLTFGDAVDSKDATKLPVKLAVALLRDSNGKIDLHLPVTGRTDDPEFHVGKVILQIIVNLLEKAATSPFALLEALYPGAAELNTIVFQPGRTTLTDEGRNKLSELAKIMNDRPSLNLEIKGYVDAQRDREGLVTTLFERKLKAVKLKDLLRAGKQASNVDVIVIEPGEYGPCLKKAYAAETFKKPSNFLGMEKTLPDEEMKKLILDHITVSDDDLKDLASARSSRVRDELIEVHSIDAGRIFLVETDPFKPDPQDAVASSRVDLTIR